MQFGFDIEAIVRCLSIIYFMYAPSLHVLLGSLILSQTDWPTKLCLQSEPIRSLRVHSQVLVLQDLQYMAPNTVLLLEAYLYTISM